MHSERIAGLAFTDSSCSSSLDSEQLQDLLRDCQSRSRLPPVEQTRSCLPYILSDLTDSSQSSLPSCLLGQPPAEEAERHPVFTTGNYRDIQFSQSKLAKAREFFQEFSPTGSASKGRQTRPKPQDSPK
jgi:hypothetical protein